MVMTYLELFKENSDLKATIEKEKLKAETYKAAYTKLSCYEIKKRTSQSNQNRQINTNQNRQINTKFVRQKVVIALKNFNEEIRQHGLTFTLIKYEPMAINENNLKIVYNAPNDFTNETVKSVLYYKDLAMLSDTQYKKIRRGWNLEYFLPSMYMLNKCKREYSKLYTMTSAGNGFYLDPIMLIKHRILLFLNENHNTLTNNSILLKVSCDGTNVSRNVKLVNLVFSVVNEGTKAAGVTGCYRIGVFTIIKEDYDEMKTWLPEIWNNIKNLQKIYYDSINRRVFGEIDLDQTDLPDLAEYDVQLLFCSDWKASAIIRGYYAANSRWPCLFCTVDSQQEPLYLGKKGNFEYTYYFK